MILIRWGKCPICLPAVGTRNSILFIEAIVRASLSAGFFSLIPDNNPNGNVNGMNVLVDANNRSVLMEALRGVITVL